MKFLRTFVNFFFLLKLPVLGQKKGLEKTVFQLVMETGRVFSGSVGSGFQPSGRVGLGLARLSPSGLLKQKIEKKYAA